MSTRQMAHMYSSGAGDYDSGMGIGQPGILDFIANMTGANNLTGGISVGQDGKISATPYQGRSGFFGRRGRMRADDYNARIFGPLLQEQERGKQERTTQKEKSDQEIEAKKRQAILDALKRHDLAPSPENEAALNGAISEIQRKKAIQDAEGNRKATDPSLNPNIQASRDIGANIEASRLPPDKIGGIVPQGGFGLFPSVPGMGFNQVEGSKTLHEEENIPNVLFKDPKSGNVMYGKPSEIRRDTTIPGKFTPAISPQSRAAVGLPNPTVNPNPTSNMPNPWDEDYINSGANINVQPVVNPPTPPPTGLIPQGINAIRGQLPNIVQGISQASPITPQMLQHLYELLWKGRQQQPQVSANPDYLNPAAERDRRLNEEY